MANWFIRFVDSLEECLFHILLLVRCFLAEPAHGPVDFRLTLHGWSAVDYFVDSEPVAPDSGLAVVFVAVDFGHPVEFQQQSNSFLRSVRMPLVICFGFFF